MPAQSTAQTSQRRGQEGGQTGSYVYGIFPSDIRLNSELTGVGDPPGEVRIVRTDGVAALVSTVRLDRPLGTPDDLRAHGQIVYACAAEVPVLPIRFGAVLTDDDAVVSDLLEANEDEFAAALRELEGHVQYVVHGRYEEDGVLREVLAEDQEAARLADDIRDGDPDATRDLRIRLGEIISEAVTSRREADTRLLGERMDGHCVASSVREPSHELDAVNVAFLLKSGQEAELTRVVDDLTADWGERVQVRVLGPTAAYDFVSSPTEALEGG